MVAYNDARISKNGQGEEHIVMSEVPLLPPWTTLVLAVWAPLGPLVGIFIAHYLLRSWQRRQWLADRRLEEWKELAGTLLAAMSTISGLGMKGAPETIENVKARGAAELLGIHTIGNRIFIGEDMRNGGMSKRWKDAIEGYRSDHDTEKFADSVGDILGIVKIKARDDIKTI